MGEPTKKTLQDLYAWSDRLADDWLGLGERLRRYADAWKADVEELRAEVERLQSRLGKIYWATTTNPDGLGLGDIQNICRPFSETHDPYADQNRALVAEIAARRGITLGHLREDGGGELAQIMRRLDEAETHVERLRAALEIAAKRFDYIAAGASREIANPVTGAAAARASAQQPNEHMSAAVEAVAAAPKRAYYETREPPHCPTCGCGGAAAKREALERAPAAEES